PSRGHSRGAVRHTVRVRGRGTVEVAAHGLADAEHLVTKELGRLWPAARVEVLEVRRSAEAPRLVEELAVSFLLDAAVEVDAPSRESAPAAAFRHARERLAGSRYARTAFERV